MDFFTHLPQTSREHDAVWVILDRLTKSAHFLVVRMTFTLEEFYRLYIWELVRLHGVPVSIVSDRDPRFTTHFWKSFCKTRENSNFRKKGKTVISVNIQNFPRSRMMKWTSLLESSREI